MDLDNAENQQVMAVYLKYYQKRQVVRANAADEGDKTMMNQQLVGLDAQENKALSLVLSPEKNKKWAYQKNKRWFILIKRNLAVWIMGRVISLWVVFL